MKQSNNNNKIRTRIERKNSRNPRGRPIHAGRASIGRGTGRCCFGGCSTVLNGGRWKHRNRSHRGGGRIAAHDLVGHAGVQCVPQFGQIGDCPTVAATLYDVGASHRMDSCLTQELSNLELTAVFGRKMTFGKQ